jgi:Flp pilus assembly secretin CpaC
MIMRPTRRALTLFTLVLAAALTTSPSRASQESQGPAVLPTPAPQGTPGASPSPSPSASPARSAETAAQRAERLKARREAAAKAAAEQAAKLKAEQEEAAAKAKAARAARIEARRLAAAEAAAKLKAEQEEAAKVAAEKAAKVKAERDEAARVAAEAAEKAKAERAARIEARRVAAAEAAAKLKAEQEEAAKVAAEKAAKVKAERDEAARVAAEAAEKAKAERAARIEARRVAAAEAAAKLKAEQEEAAKVAAEKAAQLKAERAARLEARRVAAAEAAAKLKAEQEEAARAAAEKAAKLKAEREEAARVAAEAAEKVKAERAARIEARRVAAAEAAAKLKAEQEEAARVAAEKGAQLKAERAARLEARRVAAAEAAAKLKAEQEEAARVAAEAAEKAKAERAARLEAQRVAAAEAAAKLKAEQAARVEAKRIADEEAAKVAAEKAAKLKAEREEAARVAAEAAEKAKAERAARLEAQRQAEAEAAAKLKAEQAARIEAKRIADEEAAKLAAEKAAKLKAEREEAARVAAEAAETAKAERAARIEAKRIADEEAAREAREKAEQARAERAAAAERAVADREARVQALAQARAEAAEKLRAQRAAQIENDRIAREEAARREAQAAREQQLRDQAALLAYAEAAAPEDVGSVTAVLGSGLMLNWPEASRRIAIADETIATFHVVSPREVTINGIKPGRTTIFVWLAGGRRLFYRLLVEHNLEPARSALREMNPALILESGADGESVVLRGEVSNEVAARQAKSLVEQLLPRKSVESREALRLVNLIRYAGVVGTPEDRLAVAMAAIDPRIRVRRIQSGAEPDVEKDSYVLEGTVRDVNALVQAVVLADRQLGGNGKTVKAADDDRVTFQRSNAGSSLSSAGSGGGGGNALQALQGGEPPRSGLSAQLARGLLVTSESGRVVSFLKVESLPQVMVGIRVLEVDRTKARRLGVDLRADRKNVSVANYTIPGGEGLPDLRGKVTELAGTGNLVGSYVDKTIAVIAALDFMTEKQVARSVAEPNILTLSGEQASVLVGGEVPIPTTTSNQVSTSSGFFFQQFGVRLDIRPTVDSNGLVTLEVAPSIVSPSAGLGNGSVPGFRIQRVETTARVQAGESLVLGGLLSSTESITERGLPLLGKLPIFRWQRKSIENTELLFLITPRIIVPPTETVRLPPIDFEKEPTNPIGLTGLNDAGVPFTFEPEPAKIAGDATSCVEMRERPSLDSQLLDCLVPETAVKVLEGKASWRRIEVSKGVVGWVKAEGVTPAKSAR